MKTASTIGLSIFFILFLLAGYATTPNAPTRASLVDTGYDACKLAGDVDCKYNKNLLFRGDQPLDDSDNYTYDPDQFRKKIFSYLQLFKQHYSTQAHLPNSPEELKHYRIVIINLLYDWMNQGTDSEYTELTKEFQYSGFSQQRQFPEQHKIFISESIVLFDSA